MAKDKQELLDLLKSEEIEVTEELEKGIEAIWPKPVNEDDLFTQEDVDDIVKQRLSRDRKAHDAEIKELQDKVKTMVDPSKYDELQEEFDARDEKANRRVADHAKTYELKLAALKAGVRKEAIDDFVKVADMDKIKYSDDEVEGIDDLVTEVKKSKPYFFEPEEDSSSGGSDFGGDGEGSTFFTQEQVKAMDQDEVNENLDAIEKSMTKWNK